MSTLLDIIAPELERLQNIRPKPIFGHKGFAFGNSVFAFLDDDETLVVKSEKYPTPELLPAGLTHFWAGEALMKTWIKIPIADDLRMIRKYWSLIEESYQHAIVRDQLKKKKGK
jgi:hypothetical protein